MALLPSVVVLAQCLVVAGSANLSTGGTGPLCRTVLQGVQPMRMVSIREANQSFSKLLKEVEAGETVVITRQGKPVAELGPRKQGPMQDPELRADYERWSAKLREWKGDGYRVGKITEEDKYGPLAD